MAEEPDPYIFRDPHDCSVIGFQTHVELKHKCIHRAVVEWTRVAQLSDKAVKVICKKSNALESCKQRKKIYLRALRRLLVRLHRAPDNIINASTSFFVMTYDSTWYSRSPACWTARHAAWAYP